MDKLKELLDGLVAEKSLSFEVLEQLRKVKIESEELIKTNLLLGESILQKDKLINEKNSEINTLTILVKKWSDREDDLIKREKNVLDIEHKNEIEKLKAENSAKTLLEIKEIVGMVFRNTNIRKTITGTENMVIGGGNGCGTFIDPRPINKLEEIKEE